MSDLFVPRVGGTLSADIAVPDHEREVRFYASVLTTGKSPLWRQDLMNNRGMPIIGLGARSEEYSDLPLQWMPHIQVADVAASVERALDLNGSVLMHGQDENGKSQWAVLLDPDGAAFGMIPVVSENEISAMVGARPPAAEARVGCISWLDLTIPDASTARDFYRQVVGWAVQDVAMEDGSVRYADYNMLGDDGNPAAGICHARGRNLELPTTWLLYLPVGDLTESLRRAGEEGGTVLKAQRGPDGEYSYAVIQDPVGACLALVPG